MNIDSLAQGLISQALSGSGVNAPSNIGQDPLGALSGVFGQGILGDVIGAATGQAGGAFSLGQANFGNLAGAGLQAAATAALGPFGGIAAGFLGKALGGKEGALGGKGLEKGGGGLGASVD